MKKIAEITSKKQASYASRKQIIFVLAFVSLGLVYVGINYNIILVVIAGMMLASFSIGLKIGWKV